MQYFNVEPGDQFKICFMFIEPDGSLQRTDWTKIDLNGEMKLKLFPLAPVRMPLGSWLQGASRSLIEKGCHQPSPVCYIRARGQSWLVLLHQEEDPADPTAPFVIKIGRADEVREWLVGELEELPARYATPIDALGGGIGEVKQRTSTNRMA